MKRSCGFHKEFCVPPVGSAGRLCLWWDESIELEVKGFSKKFIDTFITDKQKGVKCRASWVYGSPYREEKDECWHLLEDVLRPTNLPWFCGGDFNEILWSFEKHGGAVHPSNIPRYLHNFMEKANLFDMWYQGSRFTWRAHRQNGLFV